MSDTSERKKKIWVCLHPFPVSGKESSAGLAGKLGRQVPEAFDGMNEVCLTHTENGVPHFSGRPDLHISISHSGSWWICALSDQPLGIDLEFPGKRRNETAEDQTERYGKIARRFFTPEEADWVCARDTVRRFLMLWTAREAYVKYLGTGITGDFTEQSVMSKVLAACEEYPDSWTAQGICFRMVSLPETQEGVCCLCTPEHLDADVCIRLF